MVNAGVPQHVNRLPIRFCVAAASARAASTSSSASRIIGSRPPSPPEPPRSRDACSPPPMEVACSNCSPIVEIEGPAHHTLENPPRHRSIPLPFKARSSSHPLHAPVFDVGTVPTTPRTPQNSFDSSNLSLTLFLAGRRGCGVVGSRRRLWRWLPANRASGHHYASAVS